jgi:hypothetical protein
MNNEQSVFRLSLAITRAFAIAAMAVAVSTSSQAQTQCTSGPVRLTGTFQLFDGRLPGPALNPAAGARQKVVQLVTGGIMVPRADGQGCIRAVTIHLVPADATAEGAMRNRFGQVGTITAETIAEKTAIWQRGEAVATAARLVP